MDIGPEDVERAVFKERFRGYDQDQVDHFLDQVAAGLASLRAERDRLAAELDAARGGAGAGAGEADGLIKRTLTAAQRTAEEVLADARRQAADLLRDAHGRAEAERRASQAEAELVRRAVAELRAFRDDYRSRLHGLMSEQLAALDRAGELPRLPAAVDEVVERVAPVVAAPPQPSPAQAWAAAAAEDPEHMAEPAEDEDGLASPWDDLWRGEPEVQHGGEEGMDAAHGGFTERSRPGAWPGDHAGDA